MQRQPEAVGITGRGWQLPGALRIVGVRLKRRMTEDLRRDDRRGRYRQPFHDAAHDRIAVQRLADGRAYPRISNGFLPSGFARLAVGDERRVVARLVHLPEDGAPRDLPPDMYLGFCLRRGIIEGRHALGSPSTSPKAAKRRCAPLSVRMEGHAILSGQTPVVGVSVITELLAAREAHELERVVPIISLPASNSEFAPRPPPPSA